MILSQRSSRLCRPIDPPTPGERDLHRHRLWQRQRHRHRVGGSGTIWRRSQHSDLLGKYQHSRVCPVRRQCHDWWSSSSEPGPRAGEVVVRAIGPSLTGVSGALQDPTPSLDNAQGFVVGLNDDWQVPSGSGIEGTGLAPSDPRESAILAALPPGAVYGAGAGQGRRLRHRPSGGLLPPAANRSGWPLVRSKCVAI